MSADDSYFVGRLDGEQEFHVWHVQGEDDGSENMGEPLATFQSPVLAILAAHRYDRGESSSEYGVTLGHGVLEAAEGRANRARVKGLI